MKESMTDSCLFYYHKNDKLQGLLLLHVDDMLSCGSSLFEKDIMINLRKKYTFGKISTNNFEYTGIFIFQNDKKEIFLNQNAFSKNMPLFSYTNQHCDNLLGKKENRYIRRTTGQLSWIASQTRPDLSFDAFYLSTKLNKATFKDAMDSVKSTKKAYERNVSLKFSKLGPIEKLHIELYPDASLGNIESELKTKSMMGYFACISNDAMEMNPLNWKSKIIENVAPDIKSAETLALEQALDDTIHLGNMLSELYFEDPNKFKIPITINEDSKSFVHSIFSTKKVKRKTMRVVISKIQENITNGNIQDVRHVRSSEQLGDVLTKKGACPERLLSVLQQGTLNPHLMNDGPHDKQNKMG